jgi:hypothetical protein
MRMTLRDLRVMLVYSVFQGKLLHSHKHKHKHSPIILKEEVCKTGNWCYFLPCLSCICHFPSVKHAVISFHCFNHRSIHPWNSEPKDLSALVDNFFTPNDLFFVRNHNCVPTVSEEDYVLEIEANEKASECPHHKSLFITSHHLCFIRVF